MNRWTLHWLAASGELTDLRADLLKDFEAAYLAIEGLLPPPRLDILVQRLADGTIPEMGLVGRAYHGSLFSMTVDPDNRNFTRSLQEGALQRQIIHEVHHCLRMAGPGYGWTLGEALVSEGLAGQFVRHLLGNPPELWEKAVSAERLRQEPVDMDALRSTSYDHASWFFGTGSHPRWLGYTLGYEMVGRWLAAVGEIAPQMWIGVPASEITVAATREGLVRRRP